MATLFQKISSSTILQRDGMNFISLPQKNKKVNTHVRRVVWNFLIGGLSIGLTLVLYDGSPLRDPSYLWKLTDRIGITIFGTRCVFNILSCSLRLQPRP